MLMQYFEDYLQRYQPYKGGAWCYEDGCIYRGLEWLHRATGEERWFATLERMVGKQLLQGPALAGYASDEFNIDNIMSGRALLYLHDVTGEDRYMSAAKLLGEQLRGHPRTQSGVYWHKKRYPWQIWLDGLYMGLPFQIGLGQKTGNDALVDDALAQATTALDQTFVPETGLYAHGVDESRSQKWADPDTGHSSAHWARALGWLSMALVDIAELVGPDRFAPLKPRTAALLEKIDQLRQSNGLWLQVIDQPALPGNFPESSASAMLVYALLHGHALGLAPTPEFGLADRLADQVIRKNGDGLLVMDNICHVAGLGTHQGRYRDGTADYYISEVCVDDDAKGVGPLMMVAALEMICAAAQEPGLVD